MSLERRLRDLEGRHADAAGCRCPFDHAEFKREVYPVMGEGGRTPDRCQRCGKPKPVLEFTSYSAAWYRGGTP